MGKGNLDYLTYEKIKEIIDKMPMTYLGGILAHVIKRCITERLFKEPEFTKTYIDRVIKENKK